MSYRVSFFKELLSSDGHHFRCLQQSIVIRRARSVERAVEAAKRRFERRCRVTDWRLYADGVELEMDQHGPSAQHVNHNERRGRRGRSAGARTSKLWPGVGERTLSSLISTVRPEGAKRAVPEDAKRSRAV
jgi:hypothetical protein